MFLNIGTRCQLGHQIKKFTPEGYPFDWLIADSFKAVVRAFKQEFVGYFNNVQQMPDWTPDSNTYKVFKDIEYGVISIHDFHGSVEEMSDKFKRRANRMMTALHSSEYLIFVRQDFPPSIPSPACNQEYDKTSDDIDEFISVIKKYTDNFTLLNLVDSLNEPLIETAKWQIRPHFRVESVPFLSIYDTGNSCYDVEWSTVLNKVRNEVENEGFPPNLS